MLRGIGCTVVAYRRPDLLERCLKSILNADRSYLNWVNVSIDYSTHQLEMFQLIRGMNLPSSFHCVLQNARLGVNNHGRRNYNEAFRYCDYLVALEEDTVVAPDVFRLAAWAQERGDYEEGYAFLNLFNPYMIWTGEDVNRDSLLAEDHSLRAGCGWGFSADTWREIEPYWNGQMREPKVWDLWITCQAWRDGWKVLTPVVSRVINTGKEKGIHETAGSWEATYGGVELCKTIPSEYLVMPRPRPPMPDWVKAELDEDVNYHESNLLTDTRNRTAR